MSLMLMALAGLNVVTALLYGLDKLAARNGLQRIPENILHLLALLGGWPGALLAQWLLRHKTGKRAFRRVFALTVLVNCAVFFWLCLNFRNTAGLV